MTSGVGSTLTMGYDGLRRLTSVTGGPVSRQYTYRDVDSVKTAGKTGILLTKSGFTPIRRLLPVK